MAEAILRASSAPANPDCLAHIRAWKLNGATPFGEFGTEDGVRTFLRQAAALATALSAAQENGEFDHLNTTIKAGAMESVSTLIELALLQLEDVPAL